MNRAPGRRSLRVLAGATIFAAGCGGNAPESATPTAPVVVAVNDAGAAEPPPSRVSHEAISPTEAEDRARKREQFDKVAEERARLEAEASGATSDDPANGNFTMADATAGLPAQGTLTATIKTSLGDLKCKLYDDKAPLAVANFVGLARGLRAWKDPGSGQWVKRPAYDNTSFHRVIPGFMIQGGDPKGDGTGEPGYVLPDEIWGGKHDRAGLLCEANRGPNTNGMQFFVTDASAPHLDSGYTIFGECTPTSVVSAIAKVPRGHADRPNTTVTIKTVEVTRGAPAKAPPKKP